MKKNIGEEDRIIRIGLANIVVVLFIIQIISGTLAWGLLLVVGELFISCIIGFCPLYFPFRINTIKKIVR